MGGGIAGCSTLYHLTLEGWNDVVLLERDELTSGTTWHSAAQVTNFGVNQTMIGLKAHSVRLYRELAEDPEYPVGYHYGDGGLRLAGTTDHLDGYAHFASIAKSMGVELEVLNAEECGRRHPLLSTDGLLGGLWDPVDGNIDPAQLCQALARRSRMAGAEIYRGTPVTNLTQKRDGSWIVHTVNGDIGCEIVVNACGYRVNEVSAMMGLQFPIVSMEHQYFVTEPIADLSELNRRIPLLRCPMTNFYCRQEKQGLLVGCYEQDCKTWGMDGIDPKFSNALCQDDVDRIADVTENALFRVPALETARVRAVVNGPITYTPDGFPLVGQIPGRRNAYCIVGLRVGVGEGGGLGWLLAQKIVHGEAIYDTWCIDPARLGPHENVESCALKAVEDYRCEFHFDMPHEHRPAGRFARTTGLTSELDSLGAEFVPIFGWERAAYFKPSPEFEEQYSFRFSNAHDVIRGEVHAVRDNVGIMELNGINRMEISGHGVHDWLDSISCSRIRRRDGRISLSYFLNDHGNVKSEATLANVGDRIWYISAAAAVEHDFNWLSSHLPPDGSIRIHKMDSTHQAIVIAGPRARDVLSASTRQDVSRSAFPFLSVRQIFIGTVPSVVYALSYSGELAFEVHVPSEMLNAAWDALAFAGGNFGIQPFGLYAAESMRLEKGFRHWKAELITECNPFEAGVSRFVDLEKQFPGRNALLKSIADGPNRVLKTLEVNCEIGTVQPGNCLTSRGAAIGSITTSGYGFRVEKNLAMGYLNPEYAENGTVLEVQVAGRMFEATVIPDSPYDPENTRMRS